MRLVPDAALRLEYRRQLWNSAKRRPHITCSAFFTVKCSSHFNYRLRSI